MVVIVQYCDSFKGVANLFQTLCKRASLEEDTSNEYCRVKLFDPARTFNIIFTNTFISGYSYVKLILYTFKIGGKSGYFCQMSSENLIMATLHIHVTYEILFIFHS